MSHVTLRDFIIEEIQRRKMSIRQFAVFVGVTHPTVSRIIDDGNAAVSIEFLVKLAKATETDIRTLVAIVAPDAVREDSAEALMMAERIRRLTDEQRRLIDAMITGFVFKGDGE